MNLRWGETLSNPDLFADQDSRARQSLAPPVDGFRSTSREFVEEFSPETIRDDPISSETSHWRWESDPGDVLFQVGEISRKRDRA